MSTPLRQRTLPGLLLAAVTLAAAPANASVFRAAPDTLNLTDSAVIQFTGPTGPDTIGFVDVGIMPLTSYSANGVSYTLPPGRGMYIQYIAQGDQHFSPLGTPTSAVYSSLDYVLELYDGPAKFGRANDGTPIVTAPHLQVLGTGSLIAGAIGFLPDGSIGGNVAVTANVDGAPGNELSLAIDHDGGDVLFLNPTRFTLSGGEITGHLGWVATPEPSSIAILGVGLIGAGLLMRRRHA